MVCPVKFFHDGLPGAPLMNGTAGSRKAVLDACLVNGWGVVSIVGLSVSGGVATATVAAGHPFEVDSPALIAGAAVAGVNGEQRITATTTNTFSFAVDGVPSGSVSGTITAKIAPAGWTRPYESGNKAVYRSAAPSSTLTYFRIDDSAARYALVRGYESMSDVDTGVGLFPDLSQSSAGLYISGSDAANSAPRKWMVIADDRFIVLLTAHHSSSPDDYNAYLIGDFVSWRNPDNYNAMVCAGVSETSSSNNAGGSTPSVRSSMTNDGTYIARKYTQLGGSLNVYRGIGALPASAGAGISNSGSNNFSAGPSPIDGRIYLYPMFVLGEGSAPHGVIPGLYFVPQYLGATYNSKARLDSPVGLDGRRLVAFRVGGYSDINQSGRVFVDISGPWR